MVNSLVSATVCAVCGKSLGADEVCLSCLLQIGLAHGQPGVSFGDFEIDRCDDGSLWELGRGAMGITYRAIDKVLNRTVALKVIEPPSATDSQAVRERFLREARAAAALRHPNIAGVFQFGASADGDRCYCAMEIVEGETLDQLVRREGPLRSERVLEIATQVTRALIAAAERGLVHRDLKPGNIMLTRNSEAGDLQVKVIDFGLAKAANAAGDMELTHGGFVGTPAFASPEQFSRATVDGRTDIYALGVTVWFALTGRLPFPGTTIEEIHERQTREAPPLAQLEAAAVPQPLIELVRSCLAFNPAERPASARELMGALESCRARMTVSPREGLAAFAAVGSVTLAMLLAFLMWNYKSSGPGNRVASGLTNPIAPVNLTENPQAYLLFVRARNAEVGYAYLTQALVLYRQAITLDPKFALAHARFSIAASEEGVEKNNEEWHRRARQEAEEALRLQPDLGEAHMALANCYLNKNDPNRALPELNRAAALLPNSAEVHLMVAWLHKRQNKFRERLASLRRAEAIDPRHGQARSSLVRTLRWVRDWNEAMEALDRFAIISPAPTYSTFVSPWSRANDEFRLSGNLDVLKRAQTKEAEQPATAIPPERLNFERFEIAMFERDYEHAAQFLKEIPNAMFEDNTGPLQNLITHEKLFHEALLTVARGADAIERAEKFGRVDTALRAAIGQSPGYDDAKVTADLAIIHAFAGRKQEAIREAENAIETMEGSATSIETNAMRSALALVYARTGEAEKAVDLIEHLLTVPCELQGGAVYNMTLTDLKWRWIWDPLRRNPRFQKLLAGTEPKTIY